MAPNDAQNSDANQNAPTSHLNEEDIEAARILVEFSRQAWREWHEAQRVQAEPGAHPSADIQMNQGPEVEDGTEMEGDGDGEISSLSSSPLTPRRPSASPLTPRRPSVSPLTPQRRQASPSTSSGHLISPFTPEHTSEDDAVMEDNLDTEVLSSSPGSQEYKNNEDTESEEMAEDHVKPASKRKASESKGPAVLKPAKRWALADKNLLQQLLAQHGNGSTPERWNRVVKQFNKRQADEGKGPRSLTSLQTQASKNKIDEILRESRAESRGSGTDKTENKSVKPKIVLRMNNQPKQILVLKFESETAKQKLKNLRDGDNEEQSDK